MANILPCIRRSNIFDGFDFDKGVPTLGPRILVFHFPHAEGVAQMSSEFSTLCYELLADSIPARGIKG